MAERSTKNVVLGASPEGARDTASAARAVREMFTSIAPRYDFLNHLLSMNIDRLWWNRAAAAFAETLRRPNAEVLDLCCGTGDMTVALAKRGSNSAKILGADFSHAMLQRALPKSGRVPLQWIEADALQLPFGSDRFHLVTSAFGFRNLSDYDAGLREIARVLRVSGEIGILDFGEPKGVIGRLYRIYFRRVLPAVGSVVSGVRGPYAYLPASVQRFPAPDEMLERMRKAGFAQVSWTPFTFGIAGLYRGRKA